MKHLIIGFLFFVTISCSAQKKDTKIDSKKVDGDEIIKEFIEKLITKNDTIFGEDRKPIAVKLSDDIFGATIQKFNYDSLNKTVTITGYNRDGLIKPFYHDIAIEISKFDSKGNLIEIRNYGEDGKLISSEFEDTPIIKKKYNDKNQLIEEWYLNENEKLRAEYAIFKYLYNDKGELVSKGWYNKSGKKEKE